MGDVDLEQQEPFPVERQDEKRDLPDGRRKLGCCDKFQQSVSRWMLPEDARSTYLQRANCCPPPVFIIAISVVELSMFIYYAVWKPQKQWVTLEEGIWNSRLTYRAEYRQEAWRFLSYMFVHAGVEHIVGNLFMQLLLGIPLELVHKGFEVGMVYLAGVLAGSLASSIFDPLSALVGASGGVYALIGGYFMNAVVVSRLTCTMVIEERLSVGVDFGFAFYRRFAGDEGGMKVSFVAHFGGIVAGMTVGYVFFSDYNKKLLKDPRFWMCIVGYLVFFLFAVIFNIFISPAAS
ncbi:rhomboid-related protein 2 isoform X2 [Hippocampus zosterae]|uniref:rhomboid-related protein 2 isoform X2 n=1 Tax=Hippocampus zosterae TaxID=109293 RepID=UPI00223D8127|nr:rhomboid-related protein 2 isoform X2 [Hippocampus zosterae]